MAFDIPTTKESADRNLSTLETKINQDSPTYDKAFLRVLAGMEAMNHTELFKFAAERALQNNALTATREDLDLIGESVKTPRKLAEKTVLEADLPAADSTVIPAGTSFRGDANNILYFTDASAIASGGSATLTMTAEVEGPEANLNNGETLTIGTQIAGAEAVATVTDTINTGAEEEQDVSYRPRVLFALALTPGGANATDYKIWSEAVAGVKTAFPYTGKPFTDPDPDYPGDRTVYIECETSIDPDGIPPTSLLDEVRDAINTDPDTGRARVPLGMGDSTLYVEPISRVSIYIQIIGLSVDPATETALKSDISDAIDLYFESVRPYVGAIERVIERRDKITDVSLSGVVDDVVTSYGASAEEVNFGLSAGVYTETLYMLDPGVLVKSGGIVYA